MNSVDTVLESFRLNPFSESEDFSIYSLLIEDGHKFMETALAEASNGTTKKNIIQRLIEFVKKALKWCWERLTNGIKWIGNYLFKGKTTMSADQVAESSLGPLPADKKSTKTNSGPVNAEPEGSAKTGSKPLGSNKVEIQVPSHPASEVKLPEFFTTSIKAFTIKLDADKNAIKVNYNQGVVPRHNQILAKGAILRDNYYMDLVKVIALIMHPESMDRLMNAVKIISTRELNNNGFVQAWQDFDNNFNHTVKFEDDYVTLDSLVEFDKKLAEINKILEVLDQPETVDQKGLGVGAFTMPRDSQAVTQAMNQLAGLVRTLQYGLNALFGAVGEAYVVDARYENSVSDPEQLSKFVEGMINAHIPNQYVMFNSYAVASPELKGDGSKGNMFKPKWGQTRFVFMPNEEFVYKIAYNSMGIKSNKAEEAITNKLKETGGSDLIANVLGTTQNKHIVKVQYASDTGKLGDSSAVIVKDALAKHLNDNKVPFNIRDIHSNNIGKINGHLVAIDYGEVTRLASN